MKHFKLFAMGVTSALVFSVSVGSLGVSAQGVSGRQAKLPDVSSTAVSPAAQPILSADDRAELQKGYEKYLSELTTSSYVFAASLIQPDFNYGPDGGPNMETIINNGGELGIGDVGAAVKELQDWLRTLFMSSNIQIDGYFGVQTEAAVKAFQNWWNTSYPTDYVLDVDGIVGPRTYTALKITMSGGNR